MARHDDLPRSSWRGGLLIVPIDDPDDPRLAGYRQVRERDLVGRQARFVAEGEVVVRVLLTRARHRAESLLIADHRLAAQSGLLGDLPDDIPVYAAGQAVMDAVVGFHIHRGILALGRRAPEPSAAERVARLGDGAVVLVLFGISNHDNMGGLLRNAVAFGADAVILDPNCCDPFYRKAIRVSVGAALVAPLARLSPGEDAIDLLERFGFRALALTPAGATTLTRLARPRRAAVLLGAEGPGLPPSVLARAEGVAIPMSGGMDSLNVAVTSGIVLHHLASAAPVA
jgi:tRNA G18 (ribose-2'-O)-methylase SpoU